MPDDWPFDDADRDDPLTALRIPVVRNPWPRWKYEVCVMISDPAGEDAKYWPSLRPDDAETAMILAYLDYQMAYYNAGWKAKMRRRLLDVDSSTNTVILRKRPDGGWCYKRMSWERGPVMVPGDGEALSLEKLLDRINDLVPEEWAAHKARYAGVFTEASRG